MAESEDKTHWMQVKIKSDGELAEALAEVLGRFVSGGVVVESVTRFNAHTQENEPSGEMLVSGYIPVDETLETKKQDIEEALWHISQITPIPQPHFKFIKDQNWMLAWKAHYTPIKIGKKLLVMPAWQDPKAGEDRCIIRINPAMAFGTGAHPTTQLCMRLLENHIKPSQKVMDIGCGSGILSIAALKLGASHVLAVDVDSQAIKSTLENARLNEISSSELSVVKGSVTEILAGKFGFLQAHLVMVNILASIIIRLFEQGLKDTVEENGMLLLSGILEHQENEILNSAEQAGFALIERLSDADWVSLALQKKTNL